jgi:membrane fusion protein (multidrug efflux system)
MLRSHLCRTTSRTVNLRRLTPILLKTVLPTLVGLVALVAIIAWLAGALGSKIQPGQQAVAARPLAGRPTALVQELIEPYTEEAVGTLKAADRTVISARILATVERMAVAAGDRVETGDLLVQLTAGEYRARVEQADEALSAAIATRSESETAFQRAQELYTGRAIPRSQFDAVEARVKVARADEARARQALEEAKVLYSYTRILAPKAGRIVDRLVEPGDTVSPGQALLVLYDPETLRLEAPVSEAHAVKLKVGQALAVHIDALDENVSGTIAEIVPQADAPSRSFLVKAAVPRTSGLYEGMFGRLLIPAGRRRHLYIPVSAVQSIGQLEFVDVALSDGTLERRYVKTGRPGADDAVEALSGLRAGERVVVGDRASQAKTAGP